MKIQERVKNGWNAFMNKDPTMPPKQEQIFESFIYEGSMSSNSAIIRTKSRDQSLVDAINNRLALDGAARKAKKKIKNAVSVKETAYITDVSTGKRRPAPTDLFDNTTSTKRKKKNAK